MSDLVQRLRDLGQGYTEWRVQNPQSGAYCISFSRDDSVTPERDADDWLAAHRRNFPNGPYSWYIVAKVRAKDSRDMAMNEAADRIEQLERELDEARKAIPAELYDGMAVYVEVAKRDERMSIKPEHVSAVLDAVVRLIRQRNSDAARSQKEG